MLNVQHLENIAEILVGELRSVVRQDLDGTAKHCDVVFKEGLGDRLGLLVLDRDCREETGEVIHDGEDIAVAPFLAGLPC